MNNSEDLKGLILKLDKKSYSYYKEIKGRYQFPNYQLWFDSIQGDPFATPSRIRIQIKNSVTKIPKENWDSIEKKIAMEDFLLRNFHKNLSNVTKNIKGSGYSGKITACFCEQEVIERIAVLQHEEMLELRFEAGLPARGRSILAKEFIKMFYEILSVVIKRSFLFCNIDMIRLERAIELAVEQTYLRKKIKEQGFISFVADGSILPRQSGVSQKALKGALPFVSPESLAVEFTLPNGKKIRGMGIKKGVTVIVGGGYHGKSTLLRAIEEGVYNHTIGDGREYVITEENGIKIRAEDGRCIHGSDISLFINHLPNGQDTRKFYTENASGSTSQAGNIVEGIEAGTKLFLIDEDTSATNFMIRDELMANLVQEEPITPFIQRIRMLYEKLDISSIVVVGSSGAYLSVADTIIQMDQYQAKDVTKKGKELAKAWGVRLETETELPDFIFNRRWSVCELAGKVDKTKVQGMEAVIIGKEKIDLRYMEQLVDIGQAAALGYMMKYAMEHLVDGKKTIQETADIVYQKIEQDGFLSVIPKGYYAGAPVLPRKQEFMGMINRYRKLQIEDNS